MRISSISLLSIVLSVLLLSSCDNDRLFEDNHTFESRAWIITEEPRFPFLVADTSVRYNVLLNVRNALDYPYARIFVNFHLYDSNDHEIKQLLLSNDLFDKKTGRPLGQSGLGDLYDHQFPALRNLHFPAPGKYYIKLGQFMRQDTLKGVMAAGVRVEKVMAP